MRADPNGFAEFVTCTPATLPCNEDTTLFERTSDSRSPPIVCAEYDRLRCSRSMPSAVTTTCCNSIAPSTSERSCWTEAAVRLSGNVLVWYPMRRVVSCTAPLLPAGSTRRYLPSLSVVALTRSEGILTIAPPSGVPPGLDFTCPDTVVASCAVAAAGISPSRTNPIVRMERTNQRLSVIHFLPLLRFSGPTTGLRDEVTAFLRAAGGISQCCNIKRILAQRPESRKGASVRAPSP